ncbi:Arc family DNA-binding protein [Pseudothauera nasutitermitis]|uniref:Arc family DNA-binding protein n=1 Tax=Pseudothauera nasutitermitis TaxID=2565930 RepID=A0A4V3WBF7_9RHOO|nr:Arc family DNA-binding protein [Pseudothauera nasutitermitis]THF63079.1 Arc family DNA-binding protein [Pseudothauera nasutitermitis]
MPNLSIKNVPEALAERLRQRAMLNHRSLQGELMAIIEQAVEAPAVPPTQPETAGWYATEAGSKTVARIAAEHQARYPAALADGPRAVDIIRADRERGQPTGLLAELDGIVAGSRWGDAPILSRDQANDRGLIREIDHLAREGHAAKRR